MWLLYSILAALFWGILYVLKEKIYGEISIYTSIAISTFFVFLVTFIVTLSSGTLKADLVHIVSSRTLFWYVLAGVGILLSAEIFIASSIVAKNATLAGLIEISYPIFIALFSYIFFKQGIAWQTILGGLIIFIGIAVIYIFNK